MKSRPSLRFTFFSLNAFTSTRRRWVAGCAVVLVLAVCGAGKADRPGPPEGPDQSLRQGEPRPGRMTGDPGMPEDRERRPGGRPPLDSLSPEQRRQLRKAMASAWKDADVVAARAKVEESVKAYRQALRAAVLEAAPELAEVLPDRFELRGSPRQRPSLLPAAMRSIMAALPRELWQKARRQHGAVMRNPSVATAAKALTEAHEDEASGRSSRGALREFRDAYLEALAERMPEVVPYLEADRERRTGVRDATADDE